MSDIDAIVRAAGVQLAETVAAPAAVGTRTRYGTVRAVGACTLDVELAGGTISGVPMTTACFGAQVGDRVMLAVDGPLVTATGVLANSDNGPYVSLDKRYARLSQVPSVKAGWFKIGTLAPQGATQASATHNLGTTQYAVTFGLWGEASHWTWIRQTVIDQSENSFSVRVYNDNDNGVTVTGIWIYWVAVSFAMMG